MSSKPVCNLRRVRGSWGWWGCLRRLLGLRGTSLPRFLFSYLFRFSTRRFPSLGLRTACPSFLFPNSLPIPHPSSLVPRTLLFHPIYKPSHPYPSTANNSSNFSNSSNSSNFSQLFQLFHLFHLFHPLKSPSSSNPASLPLPLSPPALRPAGFINRVEHQGCIGELYHP